ncbi:MAG: cytochrome c biogenesis protein CcsA [Bacteroidota bacterium]|nr:cytochrome c biogenesis protein CcsA [Bacteroidota bacterium]
MTFDPIGFLGRLAVGAGFAAAVTASILSFLALRRPRLAAIGWRAFQAAAVTVCIASAALLMLILDHRFEYEYIRAYSSRDLPLGLLLSTFYAGQEGSILLWALAVGLIGIGFLTSVRKQGNDAEVTTGYAAVLAFLLLLLLVKSPFAAPDVPLVPRDGRGLNPLLRNFWMQVHPPVLFLGFAAMTPPFALALGALARRRYGGWVISALPWVAGGAAMLGLGIVLGGFWAYETLGWGGWWGWDPVENSSLIPWLVSVSAVHTMLVQKRTGGLVMTNFTLVILAFLAVLYSTFLTRSGVLGEASVHAFVDPGRFTFTLLLLSLFVFTDTGILLLLSRFTNLGTRVLQRRPGLQGVAVLSALVVAPSIPLFAAVSGDLVPVFRVAIQKSPAVWGVFLYPLLGLSSALNATVPLALPAFILELGVLVYTFTARLHPGVSIRSFRFLSRETFLGFGALTLGIFAAAVLFGTSLPVIPHPVIEWINDFLSRTGSLAAVGNTVEPTFYETLGLPLAILMMALTATAVALKWTEDTWAGVARKLTIPLMTAALCSTVLAFAGVREPWMLALGFFAILATAVNARAGWRVLRGEPRYVGAYLSHIGVGALLLGVIGSGFLARSRVLELPEGGRVEALGHVFTYAGYEPIEGGTKFRFKVAVAETGGREADTVGPVMYETWYGGARQVMRIPGIERYWRKDVYIEPHGLTEPAPSGWRAVRFERGVDVPFGGYTIRFHDIESGGAVVSDPFRLAVVFQVTRSGKAPRFLTARKFRGPDGVVDEPARTGEGDLEIVLDGASWDREKKTVESVSARIRNPRATPNRSGRDTLIVQVSVKPFMTLVWAGVALVIAGFVTAGFRRAKDAVRLARRRIEPVEHEVERDVPQLVDVPAGSGPLEGEGNGCPDTARAE